MSKKLYLFGIGGTGSRVIRSVAMLAAAGVDFGGYTLVPIIIDPDLSNADLTRNIQLLNDYNQIRNKLNFTSSCENKFFSTPIDCICRNYKLDIPGVSDTSFRDFLEISSMDNSNKAMAQMLFSSSNLNTDMNVGFKGNPNIGSVVLNKIIQSNDFTAFASNFSDGDKIFIASSIFGGTGASGFPLLLKTLRTNKQMPNFSLINNAIIGAITMLPYFKLEQSEESTIDSGTFISKAKAALGYYDDKIVKNNSIESLYFLGDDANNLYENHEGGNLQKNNAHILELFAATAVAHFAKQNQELGVSNSYELAIKDVKDGVTFNDLYPQMLNMLYCPMTQFMLTTNFMLDEFELLKGKINTKRLNFSDWNLFINSQFVSNLRQFMTLYKGWLAEMSNNKVAANFFNLDVKDKPFSVVVGRDEKKQMFFSKKNYEAFLDSLNGCAKKEGNEESSFLEMFYKATNKLIKDKISN